MSEKEGGEGGRARLGGLCGLPSSFPASWGWRGWEAPVQTRVERRRQRRRRLPRAGLGLLPFPPLLAKSLLRPPACAF